MDSYYNYSNELPYNYFDNHSTVQGTFQSMFSTILSIYLLVMAAIFIIKIVNYFFKSIGLYTLANRMGKAYPWLAWIPFARNYLHGDLAEVIPLKTKAIKHPGIWKLAVPIAGSVLGVVIYLIAVASFGVYSLIAGGVTGTTDIRVSAVSVLLVILFLVVQFIFQILNKIVSVMVNFQIIGRFTTRNMAIVHSVLSLFVPFYEALCLFLIREKDFNPGMEPEQTEE